MSWHEVAATIVSSELEEAEHMAKNRHEKAAQLSFRPALRMPQLAVLTGPLPFDSHPAYPKRPEQCARV